MTQKPRLVVPRKPRPDETAVLDATVTRFWDSKFNAMAVKVSPGEHYVSGEPDEMLVTVLGSCVSACIHDPLVKLGGMNHFMLPSSADGAWGAASSSLRYGNFAMERLINDILKRGGHRQRLQIKVFGGGNVMGAQGRVGFDNADFIERYLAEEGLALTASDLRGKLPRRVHFFPATGKVLMLPLKRETDQIALNSEEGYRQRLAAEPVGGSIELF